MRRTALLLIMCLASLASMAQPRSISAPTATPLTGDGRKSNAPTITGEGINQ